MLHVSDFMKAAVIAALFSTPVAAQDLVGPTDEWFGIDNLEITYSGGTQLFDVRFDRRAFNDVFGTGTPEIPFTSEADVSAALSVIGDFFQGAGIVQGDLRPIIQVPGGQEVLDHIYLPLALTPALVTQVGNVDDGGPTGWRYDTWDPFNLEGDFNRALDRSLDLAVQEHQDAAWAVFTLVVEPGLLGDYNADGSVTAADYTIWADTFGSTTDLRADGNGDGEITAADYTVWADNFGAGAPGSAVPEPGSLALLGIGGLALLRRR